MLGVGTTSVKRFAERGQLPCVRTAGGHRRFSRAAVLAFRRAGGGEPTAEPAADSRWLGEWIALLTADGPVDVARALASERDRAGSWAAAADGLSAVLDEIGRRWVAGELSVSEEHLASGRLTVALAGAGSPAPDHDASRAVLAGAQGDDHALGLSLCEPVLRERGFAPVWLGCRVPTADLCAFIEARRPRLVLMSASAYSTDDVALAAQAERVGQACSSAGARLVLGGRGHWPEASSRAERLRRFVELVPLLRERA